MAAGTANDEGISPSLVLSGVNRGHEDDSTIRDSDYYKPSMVREHSPIPSVVSCMQLLEETKTDNEGQDVTSEYINEIVELKLQLANHRTKVDELKASLNRCMLENEALLAEKSALVHEIAQHRQSVLDGPSCSTTPLRSSILSIGRRKSKQRRNGSIKMLLEANSQLLLQNSQLQVENNALRKSLQLQANRQSRREDRETSSDEAKLNSGHRRASFVTLKTANETLSVSSPMPDHWPALNDHPYLDEVKSDEMSSQSHASTEARVGEHDERQNMSCDRETKWPASGSHTDDENKIRDSNNST